MMYKSQMLQEKNRFMFKFRCKYVWAYTMHGFRIWIFAKFVYKVFLSFNVKPFLMLSDKFWSALASNMWDTFSKISPPFTDFLRTRSTCGSPSSIDFNQAVSVVCADHWAAARLHGRTQVAVLVLEWMLRVLVSVVARRLGRLAKWRQLLAVTILVWKHALRRVLTVLRCCIQSELGGRHLRFQVAAISQRLGPLILARVSPQTTLLSVWATRTARLYRCKVLARLIYLGECIFTVDRIWSIFVHGTARI